MGAVSPMDRVRAGPHRPRYGTGIDGPVQESPQGA